MRRESPKEIKDEKAHLTAPPRLEGKTKNARVGNTHKKPPVVEEKMKKIRKELGKMRQPITVLGLTGEE